MKKIFIISIGILFVLNHAFSKPVSEKDAKQVALNFYSRYAPSLKSSALVNKIITEKHEGEAAYYIFGFEKGGFVMVSADDRAVPILGYSFTSKIDSEFKSNIKFLFERYKLEIEDAKSISTKNAKINNDWQKLRNIELLGELKAVEPLLETLWDQSPRYNLHCPDGTPTGCVATAMSQIMNYYEWPESGRGWNTYKPETHPEYGDRYVDFSLQTYDWASMPNELTGSSAIEEIQAISTLCYNAGVAVNMNYDSEGSGANSNTVMVALTSFFRYDNTTIELIVYNENNESDYLSKIKNEIDNNRPVYYDGNGSSGGHAWVCDGYDDNDMVHINWGWGGSFNGYFVLSDMAPGVYDFTDANSIIIGIQPDHSNQDILWTKQASGFKAAARGIQHMCVLDKRTAWAVAADGMADSLGVTVPISEFTRTTDGYSWKMGTVNAPGTEGLSVGMISAIDANTAWISMFDGTNGGGKIVKTIDGGLNWVHQASAAFSAPNGFPNVVHFWDANVGWCQGDPNDGYFELYTTTDGGNTWTRVPQENIPNISLKEFGTVSYYDVIGDIIWFATNKGRIFKSIDKGYHWVAYDTPIKDASFEISFKDENIGIIQRRGENSNKVQYITENGGESWTKLSPQGNFYTSSFKFVPGQNLLISTGADYRTPFMGVSYSTDNGSTFTDYAKLYHSFQFLTLGVAGADAIWAGAFNQAENNEGLWHFGDFLSTVGFSANKSNYCANENVIFTDNSYGLPDTESWNFGEGASPETAEGAGPHMVTYSTPGTKNITLTIEKDGEQQQLTKENYILLSETAPNAAGSISGETTVNVDDVLIYTVDNQENVVFNWDFSADWIGNSTTNEIEIEFTGETGNGTITVTPSNGCGDGASSTLDIEVDSKVGIANNDNKIFSVYPSPANGFISISGDKILEATIFNSSGIIVKKVEKTEVNSQINVSSLEAGIYFINVVIDNKNYTKSFSIIR